MRSVKCCMRIVGAQGSSNVSGRGGQSLSNNARARDRGSGIRGRCWFFSFGLSVGPEDQLLALTCGAVFKERELQGVHEAGGRGGPGLVKTRVGVAVWLALESYGTTLRSARHHLRWGRRSALAVRQTLGTCSAADARHLQCGRGSALAVRQTLGTCSAADARGRLAPAIWLWSTLAVNVTGPTPLPHG